MPLIIVKEIFPDKNFLKRLITKLAGFELRKNNHVIS